jgi:hypothetical protein
MSAMKLPSIRGIIDRRILANWRVDPAVLARNLPAPFRPQVVNGFGIGGVCLIRLKQIRPAFLPSLLGMSSENAAHRIAVEWEHAGALHRGVYIPRRDTDSRLTTVLGGRVFPGVHHHARFEVRETSDMLQVSLDSDDGQTHVRVCGQVAADVPAGSIFGSLAAASAFFESGSLGYSATSMPGRFDGLELLCRRWSVQALDVERIESSFFGDLARFPGGSAQFDCALLMRGIDHEWVGRGTLCCPDGDHNTPMNTLTRG